MLQFLLLLVKQHSVKLVAMGDMTPLHIMQNRVTVSLEKHHNCTCEMQNQRNSNITCAIYFNYV